jgi:tetratricopeptide (TPR) repeat protein
VRRTALGARRARALSASLAGPTFAALRALALSAPLAAAAPGALRALALAAPLAAAALGGPAAAADPANPELEEEIERLEEALAARPSDADSRRRLGDALFKAGRAFESMRVLNPGRDADAKWVPELRQAAEIYRNAGRREAARDALKQAIELAPDDKSLYAALAAVYDADPPSRRRARREAAGEAGAEDLAGEGTGEAGGAAEPAPARSREPWKELAPRRVAAVAGLALAAGLVALLLARLARGKGDLAVTIELPPDRRGVFSVRLEKRRTRRRAAGEEAAALAERASSRFEHNMVSRDTQFHRVPARPWWVVVEGVTEGTGPDRRRAPVFEEREVRVERGRAVRLELDLRPRECPVEVRVVQGGGPAPRARLALAGDRTSLRYAPQGAARLALAPGVHRIVVGAVDRIAERELRIDDLAPKTVVIDVGDPREIVFAECESAVEPYLQGDLSVAANALERAGQRSLAHLLRARFHKGRGEPERAARQYEAAGSHLEAAEAYAEAASFERAATLFERSGDHARAAEMWGAAGDLLRAGRAHEEANELEDAARCYREANAVPKLIDVLEKQGECYQAGQLALERGDVSRAIRNYQQVDARHARYPEVCRFLAERFSEQGKLELAVQKADEAVTFSGANEASPDTIVWYGDLLDRAGKTERALRAFEELRGRAPSHPGLGERIEALRRKLSAERRAPRVDSGNERYDVLAELGRGGMGVVYKARDRRLGRVVALKRLPENLKDHPRAVELFLREARSAAVLNHPNIVTVHDVDQDDTGFFLTMELLEGQTLAEIVRARGRVASIDTARLGVQVAAGLQYAHERRIVHRDIKTANLFFTRERVVKIMDFGLAKMLEEVRKGSTVIGGTPYYMAPEQSAGEGVDPRADLYAFGVTLFELLVGSVPFAEGDVAYHHRHTPAPDPRGRAAGVPDALAELVLQMMAKSAGGRPASAAEVGARLQRIVESAPGR